MAEVTGFRNNALPYPVYGAPWAATYPFMDADGDLVTGATTPDAEVSKNGDTFADCTNESVEIATSSGVYYLLLTGTEMTADIVTVIAKSATAGMKTTVLTFYPRKLVSLRAATAAGGAAGSITLDASASAIDDYYNGCLVVGVLDSATEARIITDYTGSSKVAAVTPNWNTTPDSDDTFTIYLPEGRQVTQSDLIAFGGTGGTFSGGRPEVNTSHAAGTAWGSGAITAASIAADAITDAKVASDVTIASVTGAVGSVTGAVGSVTGAVGSVATGGIAAASFAAGAINAAAIATDAITAAKIAADAIGASELAADAVTEIQSGLATAAALTTIDDFLDTEVAAILAAVDTEVAAIITTLGAAGAGLTAVAWNAAWDAEVQSEVTDALNAYDPPTNTEMEARTLAAASYATAAALTTIDDFLDLEIAAILADTNELQTDWANGGRLDLILDSAASAGDPWSTAIPGAYGAGTAGKILGDNVNATISSRASQTSVDDVPTNAELTTALGTADDAVLTQVALVKSQTDLIPASPAAVGSAMTLTSGERTSVADALLNRDLATGTDSGSTTVRTTRQALRFLRNKWAVSAGTLTVYKEDDATASWTSAMGTDAAADPVVSSDPAGP